MKKMALLLLAALPMVFTSCGEDEEEPIDPINISLGISKVGVDFAKTYQLECNIDGVTYSSDDPFVATVNQDGLVTGKHVGTTKVKASRDGYSTAVTVTVQPVNTNFTMPILSWGADMNRIKSLVEEDKNMQPVELSPEEAKTTLGYTTNGLLPGYTYNFVDNKLSAAGLQVTEEMGDNDYLVTDGNNVGFLNQYYQYYGDKDTSMFFCNADDPKNATVLVEMEYDLEGFYFVTWKENVGTKTRATGVICPEDFDPYRAAAREVVKATLK
ncbi:MAG: Ig-like domain-containing protein [Muribaculaceae bacterium]|nr:Ig-like domain-containing protein [Muribaculaceae bacterium]